MAPSPYQRTMQLYRKYRPYRGFPPGWFDDRLWSECCVMVKR